MQECQQNTSTDPSGFFKKILICTQCCISCLKPHLILKSPFLLQCEKSCPDYPESRQKQSTVKQKSKKYSTFLRFSTCKPLKKPLTLLWCQGLQQNYHLHYFVIKVTHLYSPISKCRTGPFLVPGTHRGTHGAAVVARVALAGRGDSRPVRLICSSHHSGCCRSCRASGSKTQKAKMCGAEWKD